MLVSSGSITAGRVGPSSKAAARCCYIPRNSSLRADGNVSMATSDGSFSARKDTLCRGGFAQSSGFAQSFRSPGRTRGWIPGVVPHSHRSKCRRRSARNDDPKWSSAGAQNITLGRCAFALCVHPFPCSWPIMFLICARGAKHLPLAKILCHHEGRRSCDRRRRRPGCCPGSQLPGSRSRRFAGAAGAVRSFGGWKVHHGVVRL